MDNFLINKFNFCELMHSTQFITVYLGKVSKTTIGGGSLNLEAEGRKVLTPPKNAEMGP